MLRDESGHALQPRAGAAFTGAGGAIVALSFAALFVGCGALILVVAVWAATRPEIRNLEP